MVNLANLQYPQSSSSKSRASAGTASAAGAGLSERETIQVRKGFTKEGTEDKEKEAKYSRFLLVEPLLDETEERLWLAPEQLGVIFTSEQLIVKFALHQLIIELASLTLGPKGSYIRISNRKMQKEGKTYSVGVLGADPPWR